MDSSRKYDNPSPQVKANPFSRLFFWWLKSLFAYGRTHDLEVKDLYNALPEDHSAPLGDILEENWKNELKNAKEENRKPKLLQAIKKTFARSYYIYGIWILILSVFIRVAQPFVLGLLIAHFKPCSGSTSEEAYMYATAVVVLAWANAAISHHVNVGQLRVGMRVRIACSSLVYRKILRLSRCASNKTASGQVVNLLSNDVARFDTVGMFLHYIWVLPIQGALITYLVWRSVQVASLAGILLITIQTVPLQGYLSRWTSKLRMKIALRTDTRVRLMNEIVSGVQVIKMYAWEKPFEKLVSMARSYEVEVLTLTSYLRGFYLATMVFTERTTLFFTIMTYVLIGNEISADIAFSLAQYFNILQCTMAIFYPLAVSMLAESLVSIKRLQTFLSLEENVPSLQRHPSGDQKDAIITKNVTTSWTENSIANTLHRIDIRIESGTLCAIVGSVGSGKSSFLQLILGELPPTQGQIYVNGSVAYASQEPWLFGGSVRNNILFGQEYDKEKYREVTKVCALLKDFEQFPQGDKSIVGEKGASLSGGQRARVNLARAVYRNADIYLLDDPLSAVDTHVGKQLFDECINGYLKQKTRILVTHQIQYLKNADMIIVLDNGKVASQGSFEELQKNNTTFANLLNEDESEEKVKAVVHPPAERMVSEISNLNEDEDIEDEPKETDELMAKGGVSSMLYWQYFRAGGSTFMILMVIFTLILGQLASSGTDYWLSYWTKQEDRQLMEKPPENCTINNFPSNATIPILSSNDSELNSSNTPLTTLVIPKDLTAQASHFDTSMALWIYGGCITGSVVITILRSLLFFKLCMNASKGLHNTMFANILKAPMHFFDTNPSGRILNRFSKDMGAIDEILPRVMIESLQVYLVMSGILIQVVIINWWMIFAIIVMGFLYWLIQQIYVSSARDIKRLEGVTKSPVFSHVSASLSGLATIRSSGVEEMLRQEFDIHQNLNTAAYYLTIISSTAFGFWLDMVSLAFVSFVTYSFIFLNHGNTFAGDVGLAISQVLILCGMLQHGVRQMAEVISQMTSVERVLQFTKLEKEGPFESEPGQKPPAQWPSEGQIQFNHTYLRYVESEPPVLKDLNVVIKPGMKVGIVGRTGAGKSSLISALFRLAKVEGEIVLDNIDTKKIGLHDLRTKISIIPQVPVLFSATVRDNLDPFHKFEDAKLWLALDQVELKDSIASLDHLVNEGGTNFSAGQRQLVCLARALLRNNKVLVLDEATANVDPSTDALIQHTIRTEFKDCTVLTIAHRLNTIMDSDKVLVMDHGQIVEFDHPHLLLQNENGYFSRMLGEMGKNMAEELKTVAKEAFESVTQEIVPVHGSNGTIQKK
ncbi:ATP-binding cassette sub-family C member 4 isoform X1 [Neodiprion fabricii]|uniref:ATP-binding cassette sub-family C member 4 isoform X1 n=2 Tax=Neodiprion fabricii TaxID=2872261 RepID=UPI001ED8E9C4|nr:ATP-binding cassette sub-family C member 4 isoform X1 [Neodiprion fabricii]